MKVAIGVQINGCAEFSSPGTPATRGIAIEANNMDSFSVASLLMATDEFSRHKACGNNVSIIVPNDINKTPSSEILFGTLAQRWINQHFPDIDCQKGLRPGNNAISDMQSVAEFAVKEGFDLTVNVVYSPAVADYFRTICQAIKAYELPRWENKLVVANAPETSKESWNFYRGLNQATALAATTRWSWKFYAWARYKSNEARNKGFYRTLHER